MQEKETAENLRIIEATSLLYAQLHFLLSKNNIPHIFIKGRALSDQGLRIEKISSDVDVFIAPKNMNKIRDLFTSFGWEVRSDRSLYPPHVVAPHSLSFIHKSWPCDIDVHDQFPGMEVAGDIALQEFIKDEEFFEFAHHKVPFPSIANHAVINGLHILREQQKSEREFLFLKDALPKLVTEEKFFDAAVKLEALGSLKPIYAAAYGLNKEVDSYTPSEDWIMLSEGKRLDIFSLVLVLNTPWKYKITVLKSMLFPDNHLLRQTALYDTNFGETKTKQEKKRFKLEALKYKIHKNLTLLTRLKDYYSYHKMLGKK
ncbi:MAG: hypothetical protein QM613_00255 [Micrococcaceae bacterium]